MPTIRTLLLLSLFGYLPLLGIGQNDILDKYIQIGIAQNLQVQKNDLAIDNQQFKVAEAKSSRLPVVSFDPSYILAAGGRRLQFPVGDLFNPAYQALNQLMQTNSCLLYTSPSPRDATLSRMPSSA